MTELGFGDTFGRKRWTRCTVLRQWTMLLLMEAVLLSGFSGVSYCEVDLDAPISDAPNSEATEEKEAPSGHLVAWLTSLDAAKDLARLRRVPMLVKAGAEWCGYCQQLDAEIEAAKIQDELQRWLPVSIDVDTQPRVARDLGIGPIPALRLLTPDGRLVASHDGYLPADQLAQWLADQYDVAVLRLEDHLSQEGPPSAVQVIRIVREFDRRDPTLREAAIARLAAYPDVAAAHVIATFNEGTLSERLTALELLNSWQAPVEGVDPWQPETLTEDRLDSLENWLQERDFSTAQGNELSPAQIVEAKRLLRLMTTADPAAAAAMRAQFARMGQAVLPLLRDALERTTDDKARSRLTAARYRLSASGDLVLRWPGGIERLASQDFEQRVAAMDELAKLATSDEENLLLALFSDPAPLIREMSLRALKQVSGPHANSALVRLLDDPDPNVRAAVLKELAESPSPQWVPRIAAYVKEEQDPDLVVHAVRFLKEVGEPTAVAALVGLLRHPSWRVRAEAAAGVTKLMQDYDLQSQVDDRSLQDAFIELLTDEDAFVVSRAAAGLAEFTTIRAVDPLIEAAETHLEVAPEIVRVLSAESVYRQKSRSFLQQACSHESSAVRAAAVAGLVSYEQNQALPQLKQALRDDAVSVRIAAMDALFEQLAANLDQQRQLEEGLVTTAQPQQGTGILGWLFGGGSGSAEQNEPAGDETDVAAGAEEESEEVSMLEQIRAERSLPDWFYEPQPLLKSPLQADDIEERISAARVLALLGDADAFSVLMDAADRRHLVEKIAACLPGLVWEERKELFERLTSTAASHSALAPIAERLASAQDARTPPLLWELLGRADMNRRLITELVHPFLSAYFTENYYNLQESPPEEIRRCVTDCTRYAQEGAPWQRLMALLLLMHVDRDAAVSLAESAFTDDSLPQEVQHVVLHGLLFCEEQSAAVERAIELLDDESRQIAEIALAYLALGDDGLAPLVKQSMYSVSWYEYDYGSDESGPIVPELPGDITADQLEPFAGSPDTHVAAHAGYLLSLLGERRFVSDVIAAWEADPSDANYRRLCYRAVAHLNDPTYIPTLEQIYAQLRSQPYADSEVSEFYWTIRTMTGPDILKLRKRIREEYGSDVLR